MVFRTILLVLNGPLCFEQNTLLTEQLIEYDAEVLRGTPAHYYYLT